MIKPLFPCFVGSLYKMYAKYLTVIYLFILFITVSYILELIVQKRPLEKLNTNYFEQTFC